MKVVREKKCFRCGVSKSWIDFSVVWGKTLESSFIRRACKVCEDGVPPQDEAPQLEKELKRLLKRRTAYEKKIADLEDLMRERIKQIQTANEGGGPELK